MQPAPPPGTAFAAGPRGAQPRPPDEVAHGNAAAGSAPRRPVPRAYEDLSFPWSTVGRIDVPGGWASGVLVGPRHVLTASHVVAWPDGAGNHRDSAGWLRFTPGAFEQREPFGTAAGIAVHYAVAVLPPTIEPHEERYDYAVCVLDRRLGDELGWLAARAYDDEWDGHDGWSLLGYSGRSARDAHPTFVDRLRLEGHDRQLDDSQVIYHRAAVKVGHSGGPVLGHWPGESGPRVVAVQSWANEFCAGACGGSRMVELVDVARRIHP